jgi:hypothetical protein
MSKIPKTEARQILDALRDAGLTTDDIVRHLELWQVKTNARALRHMHSGQTTMRRVELYAMRQLLQEVNENEIKR